MRAIAVPDRRACGLRAALVLAVVAAVTPVTVAGKEKAGEPPPVVDPRADEVLRSMSTFLEEEKHWSVRAEIDFDDVLPTGQKIQYSAAETIVLRRPDRVYVEYEGDLGANRLWYDGKRITVLDGDENVYASAPVPGKLDTALDRLLERHGFSPPLSDLLYGAPYKVLRPRIQFGLYLGLHPVDGVPCHHLAFVDKAIDWQIWIEDGPRIVPRKIVITYTSVSGSPQFEARLSEWNFGERPGDVVFTPRLPSDAVELEFVDVARRAGKKK